MRHQSHIERVSWQTAENILEYFDSYKIGSIAPIAADIEKALEEIYQKGRQDEAAD